jgi:uncharacterized protein (DUF302 family)
MTIIRTFTAFMLVFLSFICQAADGMLSVQSPWGAEETMDRLESTVKERGLTVFARIDHAAGAAQIGTTLRPTELLIFGNPQGGTPLMACEQSLGIDLPLKALVWEDAAGQVWLGYNDPAYLAKRHDVTECASAVVANISKALVGISTAVVAP